MLNSNASQGFLVAHDADRQLPFILSSSIFRLAVARSA
jgi:hypothetical protein